MATATKTKNAVVDGCECFDKVNSALEESHAALETKPLFSMKAGGYSGCTMKVPVVKTSTKCKRLPLLLMSFCPFCGKKLNR